jgi:general secretion pathway protein E/type IV pilus assembly protein PilB
MWGKDKNNQQPANQMGNQAGEQMGNDMSMEQAPVPSMTVANMTGLSATEQEQNSGKNNKRIGDRLIEQGVLTQDQLKVALYEKQKSGRLIGEVLVELGFITADILSATLSEASGLQQFNLNTAVYDPEALSFVPQKDAVKYCMLPISIDQSNGVAVVVMADPYDVVVLDKLKQLLPKNVEIVPQIAAPAVINNAIDRAYGQNNSIEAIIKELQGEKNLKMDLDSLTDKDAYAHPIVRLVNAIVIDAVKKGVSDIHFEPEENFIRIRFRLDGELEPSYTFHKEYWSGMAQRLKILSSMNIADKLTPQDGRFGLSFGGREADFRVSCMPTVHGENIVLRILDQSNNIMSLEDLGFSDHNMRLIKKSLASPEGIIIVTGPTGSGKTTSLYSMINTVNTIDVNIMTLEDPVEYSLPMIRQANIRDGAGFGFGEGVKALLRQDPDIIFVGEVRDGVTAEQALKAAMTGHQVFTTLHTNDCFGAIPRLLDLGLKPGMIAGAIIASFAQRLVRRLCSHCKEAKQATEEECRLLGVDPANPPTIYHAKGCAKCKNSGYKGRVAVAEILFMDEELNDLIAVNGHKSQLKKLAREKGFRSMLDDGVEKVLKGDTSLHALMQVVNFTDRM